MLRSHVCEIKIGLYSPHVHFLFMRVQRRIKHSLSVANLHLGVQLWWTLIGEVAASTKSKDVCVCVVDPTWHHPHSARISPQQAMVTRLHCACVTVLLPTQEPNTLTKVICNLSPAADYEVHQVHWQQHNSSLSRMFHSSVFPCWY